MTGNRFLLLNIFVNNLTIFFIVMFQKLVLLDEILKQLSYMHPSILTEWTFDELCKTGKGNKLKFLNLQVGGTSILNNYFSCFSPATSRFRNLLRMHVHLSSFEGF